MDHCPRPGRGRVFAAAAAGLALAVAACSSGTSTPRADSSSTASTIRTTTGTASGSAPGSTSSATASPATASPVTQWVDQAVTFTVGGVKLYATYRHRAGSSARGPAALLIAGSGPTDRNGNSSTAGATTLNSLHLLADQLSAHGVATLRYDKLFAGQTGGGKYTFTPYLAGVQVFTAEAAGALQFLAARPATDRQRISVYGHSEGGLYALLLATGHAGRVPAIHSLALIEPQSRPILDILSDQLRAGFAAAQRAGTLTATQLQQYDRQLSTSIMRIRRNQPLPNDLPPTLAQIFSPTLVPYLRQDDSFDPARLAAALPRGMPVLLTCSPNDAQVSCADADHLAGGLRSAHVALTYAHVADMDHDLKHDASIDGHGDDADLPMAPGLVTALRSFAPR